MSTPVPQDLFSRYMAGLFDEKKIIGVPTGFQAFFGRPETGAETIFSPDANAVDIDIIRGNERIAALIPRGAISKSLGTLQKDLRSERFSSFSRKYPLCEEEGDITADNLLNRIAGENAYTRMSRIDRMRYHALKIYHESLRRIVRMDEVLAAQSIMTGKQDAIIGTSNTDLQYDFRRNSANAITPGTAWSGGSADILADIDGACEKIRANGHMEPDMIVMGATAIKSFIKDTTVKSLSDTRRYEFIQFGGGSGAAGVGDDMFQKSGYAKRFQRFVDAGFVPRGLLVTPAGFTLMIFSYLDVYTAANGTATKYLADNLVLICASQARCDRYFGPPENLPQIPMRDQLYSEFLGFNPSVPMMPPNIKGGGNILVPQAFYTDCYVSSDWKRFTIRVQHAPIFATTQTDAFAVLTVS